MTELDPELTASRSRQRSAGFVLAVTLAVVFGGVAVLLGVLLALDDGGDETDGGRQEAMAAAGGFAEAFLTFDYDDLDRHRERVRALITASYASDYERAFDSLTPVFEETETRQVGQVSEVFLTEVAEGTAQAIVVAATDTDGVGGRRFVDDIYMQLDLVRVDGEWRVDEVTNLNFSSSTDGGTVPGPQTTSTSTGQASSTTAG